jgi:5-methylcytosine-specific restriction enzyme A
MSRRNGQSARGCKGDNFMNWQTSAVRSRNGHLAGDRMSVCDTKLGAMARRSGWPAKGQHSPRKGAKRLPERLRQRILKRDPMCKLQIAGVCTGRSEQVDHIIDAADDGPDEKWNLQGTCAACHRYKSACRSAAKGGPNGRRVLREPERHPGILP